MNKIVALAACVVGLFAAYVDSRPKFDDTGVLAFGLLISSFVLGALAPAGPWRWALLVGAWIPLQNIVLHGEFMSLLALGFAMAGAYGGSFMRSQVQRITQVTDPTCNERSGM